MTVSFERMAKAIDEAGSQFVALLREVDDGERAVPGLAWTVGETAAHMLTIIRRGTGDRRRADSLAGLAPLNDECIAEVETREPRELADALEHELARLRRAIEGLDDHTAASIAVPLHAGVTADVAGALSYALFDLLAHGWDIASATGRTWHVDPALAALDLHACLPIMTPWAREKALAGPRQRMAFAFPGDPLAIVVEIGGGRYRAEDRPALDAGDIVEVDPVTTFLAVAGRVPAEPWASWFEPA